MGSVIKVAKKIVKPLERPVKKAINVVEKAGADIVEPLERPTKNLLEKLKKL